MGMERGLWQLHSGHCTTIYVSSVWMDSDVKGKSKRAKDTLGSGCAAAAGTKPRCLARGVQFIARVEVGWGHAAAGDLFANGRDTDAAAAASKLFSLEFSHFWHKIFRQTTFCKWTQMPFPLNPCSKSLFVTSAESSNSFYVFQLLSHGSYELPN